MYGQDGSGGEIDVLQLATGFVEDFAERHRDQFQIGGQALEFGRRQRGEKMVLIGIMRYGIGNPHGFLNVPIGSSRKSARVSRPPRRARSRPWRGSGAARAAQSARGSSSPAPATALPPRARAWYRGARSLRRSRS